MLMLFFPCFCNGTDGDNIIFNNMFPEKILKLLLNDAFLQYFFCHHQNNKDTLSGDEKIGSTCTCTFVSPFFNQ